MQNLSIEEKIELIHRMKNIPVTSGREMKTEGRRRILLPFFVRLIGSVILCGVIYYMIKENLVTKEVLLARVWGYESNAVENHVEVYVGFLRKRLSA